MKRGEKEEQKLSYSLSTNDSSKANFDAFSSSSDFQAPDLPLQFTQSHFSTDWIDREFEEDLTVAAAAAAAAVTVAAPDSPGIWDPKEFENHAPSSWKEGKAPKRIQDILSPFLDGESTNQLGAVDSDQEEWPFRKPCKLREIRKFKMPSNPNTDVSSDVDSERSPIAKGSSRKKDTQPKLTKRTVSDDDIVDEEIKKPLSSTSRKSNSKERRSKKKDQEPSLPRRGRQESLGGDGDGEPKQAKSSSGGKKSKRRSSKSIITSDEKEFSEDMPKGSFSKLTKDSDKKVRASSRSRKSKSSHSSGSDGRRRRAKEKAINHDEEIYSSEEDFEEDDEDHEEELKGDSSVSRNSSNSGKGRISSNSGKGRPRAPMRRGSSERWNRVVEGADSDGGQELPRSSSGRRRRNKDSLGTASYHGMTENKARARTPNRRLPRRGIQAPNSDGSGGSFGEDNEYEMTLSSRSGRTLDSIEDLEDFEHIDFQTPGMANYNAEIVELMQRDNPERTSQLQRRVGRRREAVNYDQNMPMMTRQALMTRTASTQVQRQYVDQSSIDKRRMLVRSMSNSSMSTDELSMSQHRQQFARAAPKRRPPPRTRSSGMAALSRSEHPSHGSEDRRRIIRTKSGASTSGFRQPQKPNRVQSISRRGEMDASRSNRGPPEDRKGNLSRAKSMHATVGRRPGASPKKPERRVPKTVEKRKETPSGHDADKDDSSISEDSDVDSGEDNALVSPRRKVSIKTVPKPVLPPQKKTDKKDFSIRTNRSKLHSLLYEHKMGVDMHDLLENVRRGDLVRSPWKSLVMPSP